MRTMADVPSNLKILELGGVDGRQVCEALATRVTGLTKQAATRLAKKGKVSVRVVRDGKKSIFVTMDYRDDRLNLELEQGRVTGAKCG